jgi:hypothetical protein
MPACKLHKDVFQTCLPCGEVNELRALPLHLGQQRRNGFMWLSHLQ